MPACLWTGWEPLSRSWRTCLQAAYLSRKLQAAKADFAAADEARQKLAQRDREVSATMSDMHRDMASHVVRMSACCSIMQRVSHYIILFQCRIDSILSTASYHAHGFPVVLLCTGPDECHSQW